MGKGRPRTRHEMMSRKAYRAINQIAKTAKKDMKSVWKDYKREAGRSPQTEASYLRAIDLIIDASALLEIVNLLHSSGFVNITKSDERVMGSINDVRHQMTA